MSNKVDPMSSWGALNDELRYATEAVCAALLKSELAGKRRPVWLLRIHSRYNTLRLKRERDMLMVGKSIL